MKVDLHTHSYFSDGHHAPDFVMNKARENGVTHLALTDHDCLEGYLQLRNSPSSGPVNLVPGVEISTRWENLEVHVLGLCFDAGAPGLNQLLAQQQEKRRERLAAMESKMVKAGITGLAEFMQQQPCVSPGRAHVARFLAQQSGNATNSRAFRALSRNGRFYVGARWCSIDEAVNQIRSAGGIAVLAHPHRYPLNRRKLDRLLTDFRVAGGEGLELCCTSMTPDNLEKFSALSQEHELWVSAGSDFHTSEATWMDIGRLRPIPEPLKKNAIWTHPRWHF